MKKQFYFRERVTYGQHGSVLRRSAMSVRFEVGGGALKTVRLSLVKHSTPTSSETVALVGVSFMRLKLAGPKLSVFGSFRKSLTQSRVARESKVACAS